MKIFDDNRHRAYDFAKLDIKIQDFLKKYYEGNEAQIIKEMNPSQRYELKKKILEKARIDISIPWKYHRLLKTMVWLVQPKGPLISKKHISVLPYVFGGANMPNLLEKLKKSGVDWAYSSKYDSLKSSISELKRDLPTSQKMSEKTYRGIGNLKIPTLVNEDKDYWYE